MQGIDPIGLRLVRARWQIAALDVLRKAIGLDAALRNYHPSNRQPRVPPGSPEGGQWTTEGGGSDIADARIIQVNKRNGSFPSEETANDLVNRTIERNREEVDAIATGRKEGAFFKERSGFNTGREVRASDEDAPYVRDAYGVGVLIVRDARSPRGFRVDTAYPRND